MIIVQSGQLTVRINHQTKTIGAGSVLLIMPGDFYYLPSNVPHNLINTGKGQGIYFAFQFN
jgi:quercetin dioxygenase-like cupin family protein